MNEGNAFDKWYLALTGLGVGVRLLFLLLAGNLGPYADESGYIYLALSWNHFGFYSDAGTYLWPPGHPYFLAVLLDWFGAGGVYAAKLCQILASGVVGYFLMLIARHMLDRRAGIVAGLIWCFYLPLIGFTHYLWPETLFLACFVPTLYLLVSWSPAAANGGSATWRLLGAGLLMGVSLLIKESMLYLNIILVALIVWRYRRVSLMEGVRHAGLFALALAAVVFPWTLRNYEVYGRVAPVAASLGKNCYIGVFRHYRNFDYPVVLIGSDEGEIDTAAPRVLRMSQTAPLADPDAEPFYVRIYGRDNWMYRWFIHRPPEAEWDRAADYPDQADRGPPGAKRVVNAVDQSRANVRRAMQYIREYPGYFSAARIKRLSNWISPTSFFVRHSALGRYEGFLAATVPRRALLLGALLLPMLVLFTAIPGLIWTLRGSNGRGVLRWTVLYALLPAMLAGMSRYRIVIEPVLIIAAGGFLSRLGRVRSVSALSASGIALAWLVLGFLWLLAAREVLAVAGVVWD